MSHFVIIRGSLGSGKTTISKKLSKVLKGKYIAIDRVLDEHGLTEYKEDGYISQKSFLKVNEIVVPEAKKILEQGTSVIFDGNFYWESQIKDLIQKMDSPHFVFTLKVTLGTCIMRDKNREVSHGKDAAEAVYKKSTEFDYGEIIDASGSEEETLDQILRFIGK